MNKLRTITFVLLGALGLMAGWDATQAFAAEKTTTHHGKAKVDVNRATEQELEELPGIGTTYAKKIIDNRPYKTADDLIKAGVPQATVNRIKDLIKFGKVKTEKKKKTKAKAAPKTREKPAEVTIPVPRQHARTKTTPTEEGVTVRVPPRKGMVWVNTASNVYHKEGDRWYGKTKQGKFMTEEEAIRFGAHLSKQDAKLD